MRVPIIELSLCSRCAGVFYHSPTHQIKRIDPLQVIKEECMCCRIRNGYDYSIKKIILPVCIHCNEQQTNFFSSLIQ